MEGIKLLKPKEIAALSDEERKNYYKAQIDFLKKQEKGINREIAEKKRLIEANNRKRINHAKYLIAGELINSKYVISFLKDLSASTRFKKKDAEDLNLLMESLGYSNSIKFLQIPEEKENDASVI